MKQKVGTLLEQDVVRRAKRRTADENRSLSDLIQDALERYLSEEIAEPARCDAAYQLFCERTIRLAPEQLKAVLEHDRWSGIGNGT